MAERNHSETISKSQTVGSRLRLSLIKPAAFLVSSLSVSCPRNDEMTLARRKNFQSGGSGPFQFSPPADPGPLITQSPLVAISQTERQKATGAGDS